MNRTGFERATLGCVSIVTLILSAAALSAEVSKAPLIKTTSPGGVPIVQGGYEKWAFDPEFISKLAEDINPQYAANKRLVLEFEAALFRMQFVSNRDAGNLDEVLNKYLTPDYIQHDPGYPAGKQGLRNFMSAIKNNGEIVNHPPVMIMAEGDLVTLLMRRPLLHDPNENPGYRIAIWKITDGKLTEHWGPGTKGHP